VACDPRDRSELVVPLFEQDGRCYGVLDADSHERGAFGEHDARMMKRVMEATGISWPSPWLEPLVY
jgi:GAF domain-containing protein